MMTGRGVFSIFQAVVFFLSYQKFGAELIPIAQMSPIPFLVLARPQIG
jgi:hypothetical protein